MTKSKNKNAKYDFSSIQMGKFIHLEATNPHSARTRAHQYAIKHGFKVKTWLTETGVIILAY